MPNAKLQCSTAWNRKSYVGTYPEDLCVQNIPSSEDGNDRWPGIRVYTPLDAVLNNNVKPVFIFIHGGGWVKGTLDDADNLAVEFALQDFVVVSVDYRLAPETRFPGPLYDCLQAFRFVVAHADQLHIDISRISIGGESAGGNLAISLTTLISTNINEESSLFPKETHICSCIFMCPVTDYRMNMKSYEEFGNTKGLTRADMESFWAAYLEYPLIDGTNPLASPILTPDYVLCLYPTNFMVTSEYDVLRDEGEMFAKKIENLNGPIVKSKRYLGERHGFISLTAKSKNFSNAVWGDMFEFLLKNCG